MESIQIKKLIVLFFIIYSTIQHQKKNEKFSLVLQIIVLLIHKLIKKIISWIDYIFWSICSGSSVARWGSVT